MRKNKFILVMISIFLVTVTLSGCTFVESMAIKMNLRNEDFEYIKENNVDKIIIQNARDSSFRFIINDSTAINNMYKVLSKGKKKSENTTLDPDYIFEVYSGEEVTKYNYVVGTNSSKVANFYNDDISILVPKALENNIMENLSFITKPRDFTYIYYQSILEVLQSKKDSLSSSNVGIDITKDSNCLKYVFSSELEDFKKDLVKVLPSASLVKDNLSDFDTIITVKNRGYSSTVFKTLITIQSNGSKNDYYVSADYSYKKWKIKVSEANDQPQDW